MPAHRHDLAVRRPAVQRGRVAVVARGPVALRDLVPQVRRRRTPRRCAGVAWHRRAARRHCRMRATATTAFTQSGCGMYASSSRRRYSTFHSSKRTTPASVETPERASCRCGASVHVVVEGEERRELRLGSLHQLERRLGDDAQCPLMAHEQVLELIAGGRLADLLATTVADADDLAGRQHDLERHRRDRGCARIGPPAATSRSGDAAADERARIRGGRCRDRKRRTCPAPR